MLERIKDIFYDTTSNVIGGVLLLIIGVYVFNTEKPFNILNNTTTIVRVPDSPVSTDTKPEESLGETPTEPKPPIKDVVKNPKPKDLSGFINPKPFVANEISILIVDQDGKSLSSVASEIAEIYSQKGKPADVGLIKSEFIRTPEFKGLSEGNSSIIEQLKLGLFVDYICIGRMEYSFATDSSVEGNFVCTASLSVNIISAKEKSLKNSFPIEAKGNGVSKTQAQEYALNNLLNKYNKHIDETTSEP